MLQHTEKGAEGGVELGNDSTLLRQSYRQIRCVSLQKKSEAPPFFHAWHRPPSKGPQEVPNSRPNTSEIFPSIEPPRTGGPLPPAPGLPGKIRQPQGQRGWEEEARGGVFGGGDACGRVRAAVDGPRQGAGGQALPGLRRAGRVQRPLRVFGRDGAQAREGGVL